MKLRTKIILFLGTFLLAIAVAVIFYAEYVAGDVFKKQTIDNFRIITEQSESIYLAFLGGVKARTLDWSSDATIQGMANGIMRAEYGSPERARIAKDFAEYVSKNKIPYDKTAFLVDLLDKNGIVVASTRPNRIGTDEMEEEVRLKAHHLSRTISSSFGEVFVRGFVFEEDKASGPMTHSTVRLFTFGKDGSPEPIDAVLLVHFDNTREIARALGVDADKTQTVSRTDRVSRMTLLERYETSDIYLVNNGYTMVTPSRYVQNVNLLQKVDTLPVRECLENGKEIREEYDNYQGNRVLGGAMCFKDDGLVLVVEVQKDEIFAPLYALIRTVFAGGFAMLVFIMLVAIFFVRDPLARIGDVISVAKQVEEGNLDAQVAVRSKDEIGLLASAFNSMISSIRDTRRALEASTRDVERKAEILEKDALEHEKQQGFLEESKKATINLLEDSWKMGEKFRVESNRLQTILSSIGDAIMLIDGEYKITLVNPQAFYFLAMPLQDVVGKDLREVIKLWNGEKKEILPAEWPVEEMFLTRSTVTTTLEDEIYLTTIRREKQIPVVLSVAPLSGGLSGGVIVIRDVTADRELDDAKSGFISVASHQLRTPLTSIRWYSEMLLSGDVGPLNDAQKDFMTEVHGGAERLYQTVDLLLGISRVESGKIKTEKRPIDLGVFTGDIAKELASQIDEKGSKLSILPPEGESIIVSLDPLTLRQVVLNLFSNAIRYTNPKDGIIEVAWRKNEAAEGSKSEVVYSVRDNGIGISEAESSRVFSKFFRAENARAAIPDGSGLGLALVKELVESWGGKVWFESTEGQGTVFFFTVPV